MEKFIGIDSNWKTDMLWGVLVGVAFIFINSITPTFKLFLPQTPYSMAGVEKILIVVVCAMIIEELFFRLLLLWFFYSISLKLFKDEFFSFIIAAILQAVCFSLYHWKAYGVALQTAFIGAFLFGLIAAFLVKITKSQISNIMAHGTVNLFLVVQALVVVGTI